MSQLYPEVHPDDFMKIGGEQPSHVLIEKELLSLGRESGNAGEFKKEALKLAGWKGGSLTTYASRSQQAADAFNRIRTALDGVGSPAEFKDKLTQLH